MLFKLLIPNSTVKKIIMSLITTFTTFYKALLWISSTLLQCKNLKTTLQHDGFVVKCCGTKKKSKNNKFQQCSYYADFTFSWLSCPPSVLLMSSLATITTNVVVCAATNSPMTWWLQLKVYLEHRANVAAAEEPPTSNILFTSSTILASR